MSIQGYMLAGYSTALVTTRSPGCQAMPLAIVAMPSLVFLVNAISSGWALINFAAEMRRDSMSLYQRVSRYAPDSASAAKVRRASAAARGMGATPAWL